MTQRHFEQNGIFHVTSNTHEKCPWLTEPGIPQMIIDNLFMTKNLQRAEVYAFCILPDHMHILVRPGQKGLSRFIQSFKSQSIRDLRLIKPRSGESRLSATGDMNELPKWQKGFHDEKIESAEQMEHVLCYIRCNAWRHSIVASPEDWPRTSLHFASIVDPVEIW
jgi:REP element-mobilizing transposase RayT